MPTDKRERQRANREEARQRQERQERRAKTRKNALRFGAIAVAVIGVGYLFSRGSADVATTTTTTTVASTTATTEAATSTTDAAATTDPAETTTPAPAGAVATPEYEGFRALPVACGGELPPPAIEMSFDAPEDQGIDPAADIRARLVTSCGEIVITLDPAAAPETVNSFVFLARAGYFDGTVSHRIVPGFVYQAGDPTARGSGGPGYRFADELPPADFTYTRGTLAMANSGPNTNGSQFFIVFQDAGLGPTFNVFGQVDSGFDVLDSIEAIPVINQAPQESVYIERVIIEG